VIKQEGATTKSSDGKECSIPHCPLWCSRLFIHGQPCWLHDIQG